MSNTGAAPWTLFADLVRQGVDGFVQYQKSLLDIAAQQNAMWMDAVQANVPGAMTPAMADLARRGAQAFVESQKMLLDLALQQNQMALNVIQGSVAAPASPLFNQLAAMLSEGSLAFVEAQKHVLEFAAQQAETMLKADRESGRAATNPLAQMAELSRQGVQALVDSNKKFLDMIAQATASAADRFKPQPEAVPPGERAADLAGMARQSLCSYLELQRQLIDAATRQMADWPQAFRAGSPYQPVQTMQDFARQGVEAFLNMQRAILDLTLQAMSGNTRS